MDIKWGDTQGVTQDAAGNIYVSHTVHPTSSKRDAIVVFDKHGKFVTSWGSRFDGGGHGIAIRKEGAEEFLYHCDTAHRCVVKTRLDGTVLWSKGTPEEPGVYKDGAPFIPTNVSFHPDGGFYIADGYGSSWIHEFDKNAKWVRSFGGRGSGPGKFDTPHAVWLDKRGHEPILVVSDRENHRLQNMTLDGKHIGFAATGFKRPCHVDFRHDIAVVPDLVSLVTLIDKDDKVIATFGDQDHMNMRGAKREQFVPGQFVTPHDAIFLHNGDILIAEWIPIGRITLLKKVS